MGLIAITRDVSASIGRCELTHLARVPIDLARARVQHAAYEDCLASLGCRVHRLAEAADLPDAVFVEDTAIVLDELAVITRPGAVSRRPETRTIAEALARYRPLASIEPPATLDGGDVLRLGRTLFVGRSTRTGDEGVAQLRAAVAPHGYEVVEVAVGGCLHLKSAASEVAGSVLLINRAWIDPQPFAGLELVDVDPSEPAAANALRVAGAVVFAGAFPRTLDRLVRLGLDVRVVDLTELAKAEGAVTCCSLLVADREPTPTPEASARRVTP
ncbi:MAG: dimethylarginine dimethylaminohydrolase family protein [Acidobacteriota bacterium]